MRANVVLSSVLVVFAAACATSGGDVRGADPGNPDPGSPVPDTKDDGTPHALGAITLGEARAAATGDSHPVVSVAFYPDAKLSKSCTRKVASCELAEVPQCSTGTAVGCAAGEM